MAIEMNMKSIKRLSFFCAGLVIFSSCNDDFSWISEHEKPRVEYAPNMYHSVAYDPLSQVMDERAGDWLSSDTSVYGEYYNSNPYNRELANSYTPMNMRMPAPNTIKRGFVPYNIHKDSIEQSNSLKNPIVVNDQILKDGEVLYTIYCKHCHGETGEGDGLVNNAYKGVSNLTSDANKNLTDGHMFHVITYGVRRMWAHGSQIDQEERWKIIHYVREVIQKSE
jgi:mono/diheme cytochrome c family protein